MERYFSKNRTENSYRKREAGIGLAYYCQDILIEKYYIFWLMGRFDFLFKSKEERAKDKRVKDVLKKTDDFIERTEKMLDEMQKDDRRWRSGL